MVGTRPLDHLRSYVDAVGAKLVLVGDNRQLSSIDAGGALRTLSAELGDHVVTLTTNRRQTGADQQWERDALVALRGGDVTPAVHAYSEHGRVTISGTINEARQRIVEDWWVVNCDHTTRDQTTAILAVRRSDVAALNDMVRARRQAAGELGEEGTFGAKAFSVGDRVIFEKNQRVKAADLGGAPELLRLRNGTFGTVVAVTTAAERAPTDSALTREGDASRTQGDVVAGMEDEVHAQLTRSLVVQLDDGRQAVVGPPPQLRRNLHQPGLCPHGVPLPGNHRGPHLRPRWRQPLPGGRLHPAVPGPAVEQPLRRLPGEPEVGDRPPRR